MLATNFDSYKLKVSTVMVGTLSFFCSCQAVRSQVISDPTTNTQVKVKDNVSHIMGGVSAGNNLFHSFKQFSLDTDGIASFENSLSVENIFSRVTGGNISQIDGAIAARGDANLFLINPAGIIFGANSSLNIGGSFIASTAEAIMFESGEEFGTKNLVDKPILIISAPMGLQYGGGKGKIEVLPNLHRGRSEANLGLSVKPGNTLALLGGDVTIARNDLNAIASNVEIGSVKTGKLDLQPADNGWEFDYDRVLEYGVINLSDRALINSSGVVNFHGKKITLGDNSVISNFTNPLGGGGTISLEAQESIDLDSSFLLTQVGQTARNLDIAISEAGGNILIKAPQIAIDNGSFISAGTLSEGAGGNIMLEAADTIKLSSSLGRNPSLIGTSTQGKGDGGQIQVSTSKLIIDGGSQIQALGREGAGGTIEVFARESIQISGTGILRSQDSSGNLTEKVLSSGFAASAGIENPNIPLELQPSGKSGNLIIQTPQLTLENSAGISVNNFGLADAGDIQITTDNLNLNGAAEITANTASGKGGSIGIFNQNEIVLDGASNISTTAEENGNGGNIFVEADHLLLSNLSRVSADAKQGSGGNIRIDTQGYFIDSDSQITASSQIETQAGTVEVVNLDLNSRLFAGIKEYSPLITANLIHLGCGAIEGYAKNSFRNIGRGGIPHSLTREIASQETLGDLGGVKTKEKSLKKQQNDLLTKNNFNSDRSIVEANTWQINPQGKVELIAQHNHLMKYSGVCPK